MDSQGRKIIVVDNGTGVGFNFSCSFFQFVKCGYAGTNFPSHIFPTAVGRPIIRSSRKVGKFEVKVRLAFGLNEATKMKFSSASLLVKKS